MNINWTEVYIMAKETCMTPEGFAITLAIFGLILFIAAVITGVGSID